MGQKTSIEINKYIGIMNKSTCLLYSPGIKVIKMGYVIWPATIKYRPLQNFKASNMDILHIDPVSGIEPGMVE